MTALYVIRYKLATRIQSLIGIAILSAIYYIIAVFRFSNDTWDIASGVMGFLDTLVHLYAGERPFNPTQNMVFTIPIEWITLQVLIAFFIGFHANDDLHTGAANVIMRSMNTRSWWTAQCIWTILVVTIVYAVGAGVAAAACLATHGSFSSFDASLAFFSTGITNTDPSNTIAALAIAPCASYALSLVQITISTASSPFAGLLATASYQAISAYSSLSIFSGDCGMVARNAACGEAFQTTYCIEACGAIAIASFLIGLGIIKHRDIR